MSVLFPKVNKPREWDYRPIYYDKEKDERAAKLAKLRRERQEKEAAECSDGAAAGRKEGYVPTLHRGSFREARRESGARDRARRTSRLTFWLVLLMLLALVFWLCSNLPLWLGN